MEKIRIQQKILRAMGLSDKESAVFDILLQNKNIFGLYATWIAKKVGVSNKIVRHILLDLEKRDVIRRTYFLGNVRPRWKYKKGLERF